MQYYSQSRKQMIEMGDDLYFVDWSRRSAIEDEPDWPEGSRCALYFGRANVKYDLHAALLLQELMYVPYLRHLSPELLGARYARESPDPFEYRVTPHRFNYHHELNYIAANLGYFCALCKQVHKGGMLRDDTTVSQYTEWWKRGICAQCDSETNAEAAAAMRERKRAEKDKKARETAAATDEAVRRARLMIKEQQRKRRIAEKASYELVKEMGLLKAAGIEE